MNSEEIVKKYLQELSEGGKDIDIDYLKDRIFDSFEFDELCLDKMNSLSEKYCDTSCLFCPEFDICYFKASADLYENIESIIDNNLSFIIKDLHLSNTIFLKDGDTFLKQTDYDLFENNNQQSIVINSSQKSVCSELDFKYSETGKYLLLKGGF